ncbi:hypothetical protein CSUB01_04118 [Colletotrichum sublineola]|uniref:Uncharacterized protein n=1 Tax=Colletotrichum sublineola TaxID=1173701 RepID=A0A066XF74_COLSU|nr:hypothetical protein CSUB01_04118 [Colletotrichum sublineola]
MWLAPDTGSGSHEGRNTERHVAPNGIVAAQATTPVSADAHLRKRTSEFSSSRSWLLAGTAVVDVAPGKGVQIISTSRNLIQHFDHQPIDTSPTVQWIDESDDWKFDSPPP